MDNYQDYLIDRLVKDRSSERLFMMDLSDQKLEGICNSISPDNMYLISGCKNSTVIVCNLKRNVSDRIVLKPPQEITAVYLFKNTNFTEIQYKIFVGTTSGNLHEYNIVETDEKYKIIPNENANLHEQMEKKQSIQSIYYFNFILYSVSQNSIKAINNGKIDISIFQFEIKNTVFSEDFVYLALKTNEILSIPLNELKEDISPQKDYVIYKPAENSIILETFSVFFNEKEDKITLAVIETNQEKKTIKFYKLEKNGNNRLKVINQLKLEIEKTKTPNFISLIDQNYVYIGFDSSNFNITKYDFENKQFVCIKDDKNEKQNNILGAFLLKNTISYPTILVCDSKLVFKQYQIGNKAIYQIPFIFWVWMRAIKDLELESLMSENYSKLIMEELRGSQRGELVLSNQMFFQQEKLSRSEFQTLNQIWIATELKILIFYGVKEGRFQFFEPLIKSINRMKNLKYFDISYSTFMYQKQHLKLLMETLKGQNMVLDFLGLAGLQIGVKIKVDLNNLLDESQFEIHAFMEKIDEVAVNVSLRDNGFNDDQGLIILRRTQQVKNLKMLDISNNQFEKLTLSALQLLMNPENVFFYRFAEDFSLKMLCISFSDDLEETAMKAVTDYLIRRRMNNNLYIYITRKMDTIWDRSISQFVTLYLRNEKVTCMTQTFTIFIECLQTQFWILKKNGLFCLKQILCTTFFIKKYVACCICTFLTTELGKYCVLLCGAETSYYEFNDQLTNLENSLQEKEKFHILLLFFHFALYYSFVIALPFLFVNKCSQSTWTGHFIYLIFVIISMMIELYIGNYLNQFKIAHQYYMGTRWERYSHIGRDLIISQLSKFTTFTCICFIVLTASCQINSGLYILAIIIISLNQLAEFIMIMKNVLFPYWQQQIKQTQVLKYFAMFQSMNMVNKQLQKCPEGENNYKFFGEEDNAFKVPRQVFQIITTLILQDFPMLIIQLANGAKNSDQTTNQILLCSLLIMIIHCFYLVMKLLTITRAGLINEDVTLYEYQKKLYQYNGPIQKSDLQKYVKTFFLKLKSLFTLQVQRNYSILASIETDYFKHSIPANEQIENAYNTYKAQVSSENTISQKRLLFRQEEKKINFNQKIAQQKQFLSYYSQIYGKQVESWKPNNDMPYCIVDTLLIDVPRTFFVADLQWIKQYDWIKNIKISSLQQEVEGFDYAYEFFKDKQELDILDLGFGSGYVALVLLALALRRNPRMTVRLYLVDHIKETQEIFEQILNTKFENLKNRAAFNYSIHDCLQGFTIFEGKKFDFIHMGFGATKWRIEKQIINLLKEKGKLFGYKLVTSALQKQFTWDNQVKQFKYNLHFNLENYGIMEPKIIQEYSDANRFTNKNQFIYPEPSNISSFKIQLQDECAVCGEKLTKQDKQFINPYWGECICFSCGTNQLKQQGEENDIGKLQYRCDVIFYSGEKCLLSKINSFKFLFENRIYPIGKEKNRKYKIMCRACKDSSGFSEGFKYVCLVCTEEEIIEQDLKQQQLEVEDIQQKQDQQIKQGQPQKMEGFCNSCGLEYMNQQTINETLLKCFQNHPILRIMFPAPQDDNLVQSQGTKGSQILDSKIKFILKSQFLTKFKQNA